MSELVPVPDVPAAEPLVSAQFGDWFAGARCLRSDGWTNFARCTFLDFAETGRTENPEDRAHVVRPLGPFGLSAPG